ncbi:hypothetical protein SNE40_001767 [Patella caerulea]|uniref:Uncharacterized protein n=1 Tax=Patella caerulea TaxID=87958 RepID=A0AAN8QDM4_PATCE
MKAFKKKRKCWYKYRRNQTSGNYEEYRIARNHATSLQRTAHKEFEKSVAADVKDNPKSFWKYVRSKTKKCEGISNLEKEDGTILYSNLEKAVELNNFFCGFFSKENTMSLPTVPIASSPTLDDIEISQDLVYSKLQKLNTTKSPGPDNLHPKVLKELAEVLKIPLSKLYRKSVDEGVLPEHWKAANITPLYKKGSKKKT